MKNPTLARRIGLGVALFSLAALLATATVADESSNGTRELPRGHFHLPEAGNVIGEAYTVVVEEGETLLDIGRRHNAGYEEMRMANPDVSIWAPQPGTEVVIPAQHILPDAPREGIVVNLSELRLYYYSRPGIVETYPISIGRDGFATPVGVTRTTVKVKDPHWSPPRSMREEAAARGEPPPAVVPPGPDNPLGRHAILLGLPSYLIHGTNMPDGVGMRASRGCIRMFPEDIESLYERVPSGTQVNIIDQPFKVAWSADGVLYAQSFPQLEENQGTFEPIINAMEVLANAFGEERPPVDYAQLRRVVENPDGRLVSLLRVAEEEPAPVAPQQDSLDEGLFSEIELGQLSGLFTELEAYRR
ncbi:L,D-transpeptidase family protein [Halomonas daqingensis]|uniref:L,D-transpeptidase family protein n=1 Tax=Billgrantia desiderata TaxID=52021 RepID=A0AAW4YYV6_9GAMM|nr:L,D-transpeptidase family protein [Halomonas desiderata]MCE8011196.1 L,D-transpeptidase family protein [Halomonas desiderata]MCE8041771.1 L,D-transpeptidase family protein [Halomonas desiderata]MCE8046346.1 L,D-transpeptidase family protein [Halomonas desiderata]MCE8052915.1 L,D-transpeptidase family protein [Halomonas desiderata]